jgi:transposase
VWRDPPLRGIRAIVNEALAVLGREFVALYSPMGRPSIPPEKLLPAMLLQTFYSIRSETNRESSFHMRIEAQQVIEEASGY